MKNFEIKKGVVKFVGNNIDEAMEAANPLADWQREFSGTIVDVELGESTKGNGFAKLSIEGLAKPAKIMLFRLLTEWVGDSKAKSLASKGFPLKDLIGLHCSREGLDVKVEESSEKGKKAKAKKAKA